MDNNKEFFACLALRHSPKLGQRKLALILDRYESAYSAVQDAAAWTTIKGIGKEPVRIFLEEQWRQEAEKEYKDAKKLGMDVLTWYDERYPEKLREIHSPPLLLYYCGELSLLNNPSVAVVGARECTQVGLDGAGRISAQLSEIGITVVSGLALGIDSQAHIGGLRGLGSSVAVLGCGLDIKYPSRNSQIRKRLEENGLVVTEYPPGEPAYPSNFPRRNRIISGLSLGVLVAEAANKSGSLITARYAAEQGRDVFALPGPIGQRTFTGCNKLIKQGAALVESASDIVEILRYDFARELENVPDPDPESADGLSEDVPIKTTNRNNVKSINPESVIQSKVEESAKKRPSAVEREAMKLNDDEQKVMTVLDGTDKVHIDVLGRTLAWEMSKVSKTLLMLELRGAVQQLPGMWYLAKETSC